MTTHTVAVIQMNSTPDVQRNLKLTEQLCHRAAEKYAKLMVLPENFAYFGPEDERLHLAESLLDSGPILTHCKQLAIQLNCELVLGGFPEKSLTPGKTFNSCIHLTSNGEIQATYRKLHLFDVDLSSGHHLRESNTVEAGSEIIVTSSCIGPLGLSICYDLRFPELYGQLVNQGATTIAIPAAFTKITGKDHWEILLRARAIESQCYVLAAAQAGHHYADRYSYGHAMIIDPWGKVLVESATENKCLVAEIDLDYLDLVRSQLPSLRHRQLETK